MLATSAAAGIGLIAGIVGVIVGLAGVLSVIFVLAKQKALEGSLALFALANDELRAQVDAGRDERRDLQEKRAVDRETLRTEFEQRIADERAECARVTGHLQGQLTVLTQGLGRDIAASVLSALGGIQGQVEKVAGDVATVNGLSIGELADQAEGRRIRDDVPKDTRTEAGQAYVDRLPSDHPAPGEPRP